MWSGNFSITHGKNSSPFELSLVVASTECDGNGTWDSRGQIGIALWCLLPFSGTLTLGYFLLAPLHAREAHGTWRHLVMCSAQCPSRVACWQPAPTVSPWEGQGQGRGQSCWAFRDCSPSCHLPTPGWETLQEEPCIWAQSNCRAVGGGGWSSIIAWSH